MMFRRSWLALLLPALSLILSACSGGGTQVSEGGIGGTGISQGGITGFGSVWVNGVEFNTTNATISREGVNTTQSDLSIGMIVTVDGTVNPDGVSGTATRVAYSKNLEGPISAIPNANSLIVLGQTIIVDNLTKFSIGGISSPTINDLSVNTVVEVSGQRDATGALRATYIQTRQPGNEYEVTGSISTVAMNGFTIGGLTIDSTTATLSNFGGQPLAIGDFVKVKGQTFSGNTLMASNIELGSDGLGATDAQHVELQGFVSNFTSASSFMVNMNPVITTANTAFNGGVATDMRAGVKIEVEGSLVKGTIIASKIKFQDNFELEADIASVDNTNKTMTLAGIPGVTVTASNILTEYGGVSDFSGVTTGHHVRIRGRQYNAATCPTPCILATELEIENSKPDLMLRGTVDTSPVVNPYIGLLGLTIDTTNIQDGDFGGHGISGRTTFFSTVKKGDQVEIIGILSGTNALWTSIELDN